MHDLRAQLEAAVRDAEAGSTVWLGAGGDADVWASVHGATDGQLEVHVAEPRRWGGRRRDPEGEQALALRGFTAVEDAWVAPASDARDAVARLEGALREVFRAEAPLPATLRWDGSPLADRGAPPADHVAAALGTLTRGAKAKAVLHVGRPAATWAWAFAVDGELVMSPEAAAAGGPVAGEWAEKLAPGAEEVAVRRLLEVHPPPPGPLFVQLID